MAVYGGGTVYGSGAVYGTATTTTVEPPSPDEAPAEVARLDDRWEFTAPGASEPLTIYLLNPAADLLMESDPDGLDAAAQSVVSSAIPGGYGATARAVTKASRLISARFYARAATVEAARQCRADVAAALSMAPTAPGSRPQMGMLRIYRSGRPPLEVAAVPVEESPRLVGRIGTRTTVLAADFYCPDPRFREVEPQTPIFLGAPVAGFTFPLTFPFTLPSRNDQALVVNDGTASPLFVEFRGEATGAILSLVDDDGVTVEQLAVDGTLAAGARLVVEGGNVTLFNADGSTEDGWDLLEPVDSNPFDLPSGSWKFTLTADSMPSGSVRVVWHRHRASA